MIRIVEKSKKLLASIRYGNAERVFCISMQRTGTTSVGKFFRDFGYRWAGWQADQKNSWSRSYLDGDFEKIFSSIDFRAANAFEDCPWWIPGFYKVLFHRFPYSKFVLFTRDPDLWFASMIKHSGGNVMGETRDHCKVYRREMEYYELLKASGFDEKQENQIHSEKTMKLIGHEDHYKAIYDLHITEVQDFFRRHSPESLHVGRLEDPDKWTKLGKFLGITVPQDYISKENVSPNK